MNKREEFSAKIFDASESNFELLALEIFSWQAKENLFYKNYIDLLKIIPEEIKSIQQIPFLPIEFFKKKEIKTQSFKEELIFISSGTTTQIPSKHFVRDKILYEKSFLKSFELFIGNPSEFCILALLPSYLEREGSSLIYMMKKLIDLSGHCDSGFYLNEFSVLNEKLISLREQKQRTILLGVSFALLDFADVLKEHFPELIIVETGGMKGQRKEMLREELHTVLINKFSVEKIYSEYGMTELYSQSYSIGDGKFKSPPWMKILIRDMTDVFEISIKNKTGAINIIDLANIDSCCFISTSDLGKLNDDETFEVLGRADNSEQRGCNLMID